MTLSSLAINVYRMAGLSYHIMHVEFPWKHLNLYISPSFLLVNVLYRKSDWSKQSECIIPSRGHYYANYRPFSYPCIIQLYRVTGQRCNNRDGPPWESQQSTPKPKHGLALEWAIMDIWYLIDTRIWRYQDFSVEVRISLEFPCWWVSIDITVLNSMLVILGGSLKMGTIWISR